MNVETTELAYQFKDEWLMKATAQLPQVRPESISLFRYEKRPYLAEALVKENIASAQDLGEAIARVFHIDPVHLCSKEVDKMALALVPEKFCRKHQAVPFRVENESLHVAMAHPLNPYAQSDLEAASSRAIIPHYCLPHEIDTLILELFTLDLGVMDLLDRIGENETVEVIKPSSNDAAALAGNGFESPVIRLVDGIIAKAVRLRASDIHIEHEENESSVRYRVDGALRTIMSLPKPIAAGPVVSRLKIMSELDLTEHFRPQDGRAKLLVGGTEIGLRVSTLPTAFGEKVVMRILDPRAAKVPFEQLGFRPEIRKRLEDALRFEQGMVLITGPTGSGKTTSLYSLLNKIRSDDTNIVTVEDPIEYKLEGINQVQVNVKQGLTFAGVLRSVLRQDPDVILVGEIRDRETADTAFQAALTGHLVFSTLHTNDTLSALSRLLDMGVERFKMAPALLAITAQRLVRRLCPHCKRQAAPDEMDRIAVNLLQSSRLPVQYFMPAGCELCGYTGFKGRLSIIEFLEVTQEVRDHLKEGSDEAFLRRMVSAKGLLYTMSEDALWHLAEGDTSLEEINPYLRFDQIKPGATAPSAPAAPEPAGTAPVPNQKRRILVTDDNPDQRIILGEYLRKEGYEVEEAADGMEALEKIARAQPDLLLLDIMMPKMDGYGVIRSIRRNIGLVSLPIIVLTAITDEKSQEQTIDLGADDYIVKPFKPSLVSARVNALFRRMAHKTGS